jgi:hypothetical protein
MAKTKSKPVKKTEKKSIHQLMVFKKQNYILLIASLVTIVIGFFVMGSGDQLPFDHPIKITVAPLIVLFGFALGVFSILYTPKSIEDQESTSEN